MKTDRRNFIKQTGIAAAGIGIVSAVPGTGWARNAAPSDKINVALIGCRSMGFGVLKHQLGFPEVNCVALCDVDENVLNNKAAEVEKDFNQKPILYRDFRKLLENKDIDAVIIGTPDHWHCLNAVYALQAGKHVYVEKPMANSIAECNIMVAAAKRYGKIMQVGQQQRSGFVFNKSMEIVKSGGIGNIRKINMWANFAYGLGPKIVPDEPVPNGVDYDLWLGPAPIREFNKNRFHGSWRHFWNYGSGMASDWGVHLLDIGLWVGDDLSAPSKTLVYAGNTFKEPRARETFDSMNICFPKKEYVINFDITAGPQRGPWDMLYGIAFIGDNGTLVADRSKVIVYPEWDNELKANKAEAYEYKEGKESHKEHSRNFIDSIKNSATPNCTPEMGRAAALHMHIANIAGRTGEPVLLWDEATNRFTNSEAANAFITPEYRKPWTLPTI
jgi:predicted dehydrogenase